jgi:predicted dehydrogenase
MSNAIDLTIVGGGMITYDLLLPSIYHLQRTGLVGAINICALNSPPLKALAESDEFKQAFPGQSFTAFPEITADPKKTFPDLFKELIASMKPYNGVVVAMPDHLHYPVIKEALKHNQHVLTVKPLVLKHHEAAEIEHEAHAKGLFVGVEYHKRFDRRALLAKKHYALGQFGEFKLGEARLIEPWYYRHSNFQNWFTKDNTDPFTYVGCHYVDLVYFITGLKPVEVSVQGVEGTFPNGNKAYMWANGRVRFENGALLSVNNGLGYPDEAAGSNDQGLIMFCEGNDRGAQVVHNDQFRGVTHCFTEGVGPGGTKFNYINPDFFKLVPWEGAGYKPAGYGYDSVAASIGTMGIIRQAVAGKAEKESLVIRQKMLKEIDAKGIIATPANSFINELVMEATRKSIAENGRVVKIVYQPEPRVE